MSPLRVIGGPLGVAHIKSGFAPEGDFAEAHRQIKQQTGTWGGMEATNVRSKHAQGSDGSLDQIIDWRHCYCSDRVFCTDLWKLRTRYPVSPAQLSARKVHLRRDL